MAGVALGDIHLRFTWQVWHKLTSTFVLRGRRGTYGIVWRAWSGFVACDAAAVCVAGVALGDIHLRFTWQVWHKLTSTFVLRGRRGTYGIGWRAWSGFVARDAAAVRVAGVVLGDIHLHFSWPVWHKLTSTVVLRGRRGAYGIGWRAWSGFVACDAAAVCVAGVALGDIHLHFSWPVWHKLTSTVVLRGRRGAYGIGWRAWSGFVACDAAAVCVAGVALGDIHLRFTWQAWHKLTSTVVLRGRRGTYGMGLRAWSGFVARDAAAVCVAGVVLGDIHLHFRWQAWHKRSFHVAAVAQTHIHMHVSFAASPACFGFKCIFRLLRLRSLRPVSFRMAGVALMALSGALGLGLVARDARDAAALCVAGVAQSHIHLRFAWQAWHNLTSTFVFAWQAWDNLTCILSFHIPSCFVTHRLSHSTLSHTTVLKLLDPSPPPLSFLPSTSPLQPLKLIIGRSWLVGLSGPLIFAVFSTSARTPSNARCEWPQNLNKHNSVSLPGTKPPILCHLSSPPWTSAAGFRIRRYWRYVLQ